MGVSKLWTFLKSVPAIGWLGLVAAILLVTTVLSVRGCIDAKGQRDAAYEVANRQMDLGRALGTIDAQADERRRVLEEEARKADEQDEAVLQDLYERVNKEGSAAGVLNDLINAGELP